ncbi:MAG: hypothetical protein RIQ56_934 [Candidatus Parcubacteria bacterium]|jgi:hypothetical protein
MGNWLGGLFETVREEARRWWVILLVLLFLVKVLALFGITPEVFEEFVRNLPKE